MLPPPVFSPTYSEPQWNRADPVVAHGLRGEESETIRSCYWTSRVSLLGGKGHIEVAPASHLVPVLARYNSPQFGRADCRRLRPVR
jgi:hypothetical protein